MDGSRLHGTRALTGQQVPDGGDLELRVQAGLKTSVLGLTQTVMEGLGMNKVGWSSSRQPLVLLQNNSGSFPKF